MIPLALLALGAGGLAIVWKVETRWISLPVGLFSILLILVGCIMLSAAADRQYNEYLEENKEKQVYHSFPGKRKQNIIYYTIITIASILIYTITISGHKVENYLDWKRYILELIVIGGTGSAIFTWLYREKFRISFTDFKRDDHIQTALFFIPLLVTLHASVWYNHLKPSPIIKQTKAVVTSDGRKYIHLAFEGEVQRFTFGYSFNESVNNGDSVLLTIKQGALGYPYASHAQRIR